MANKFFVSKLPQPSDWYKPMSPLEAMLEHPDTSFTVTNRQDGMGVKVTGINGNRERFTILISPDAIRLTDDPGGMLLYALDRITQELEK